MTLVDTHEHKNGYHIHTKDILEFESVSAPLNYKKFIQLNPDSKVEKNMGQIFISYARDDDESFVKKLYQDLTENGIDVWWDRKALESRGRTFLQELRDAIEASDRPIAVIGPTAVTSDYVKAEWEHALLFAKGVVPILRMNDYDQIPSDLSKLHCPDFRKERPYNEALEELLDILAKPVPLLGPLLTAVPSLPPHFLPLRDEITRLGETVLADVQQPTVITSAKQTTALQGMGGVGKSVMAAAFARATETRRAFTDGVIWLTIGEKPDPSSNMKLVGLAFGDNPVNYVDLDTARARLPGVLSNKVCLIVLDDVWNVAHATPFVNALGPRCRLLITTRDGSLVTALGAQEHSLDVLTDAAALQLLANWCDQDVGSLPSEAVSVASECGNLPLALALCGAMARDGTLWSDMLEALEKADLTFIEGKIPNYPYPDVLKALKVSVDALAKENSAAAEHYHKLAVFPADEAVPEAAVLTFWLHTDGLKERDARRLLTTLERKALLRLEGEAAHRLVSLHDLQYDYLRAVVDDFGSLHSQLLEAYQNRCADGWQSGPNDGYFFEHLTHHLVEAGRKDELHGVLFDFGWLEAKLNATDVNSLIADYDYLTEDKELRLVQGAIRLSANVLSRDKTQLAGQLMGRMQSFRDSGIQSMLKQAREQRVGLWLCPLTASLMPPGGQLIRILEGHTDSVYAVAVTPDGKHAISGSWDNTLRIWDIESGEEIQTLEGHTSEITAVAVTPDGKHAISGSKDNTLRVWNIQSGEEIQTLEGHTNRVYAIAVTPDGKHAISGSEDNTLSVWDIKNGEEILTLEGHTKSVYAVAVIPDGKHVISGSGDKTLKVWDIESGEEIQTLEGHTELVKAVAVTPDGKHAISGSSDNTLRVWDIKSGEEIQTLEGHARMVTEVAVTPNGKYAISGSMDYTLSVWDIKSGEEIQTLEGHTKSVCAVAVTPDGRRAISGSGDKTLKVWDIESGEEIQTLEGHTREVTAVAVTPDGRRAISGSNDNTLRVWDIKSGEEIQTLEGHTELVKAVAVTPDGKHAISGSMDYTLSVWDIKSGEEIQTLEGHTKSVCAVAVTPDGRRAISGSGDKTLKVWDIESGEEIQTLEGHTREVTAVAVTPDGRRAISGSNDNTLRVWDIKSGEEIQTLEGHTELVKAVAVTPDGKHAISGSYDKTLRVWDIKNGEEIQILEGHTESVNMVVVTPDGKYAISGSGDKTLKVWDIEVGQVLTSFSGNGFLHASAISPDSRTIIAGDASGRVHFLRLQGVE
jgi:WD40 repeat protein